METAYDRYAGQMRNAGSLEELDSILDESLMDDEVSLIEFEELNCLAAELHKGNLIP